jgi:uncharacterized membrane protein
MNDEKLNAVSAKTKANNALYEAVASISKDAAVIFQDQKELRKQFSYSFQLAVLKGGAASFKGYVTDAFGQPVHGVVVGTTKYEAVTNEKGYFDIKRMTAGEYVFTFSKEGYMNASLPVVLSAGTSKTVKVQIALAMQAVA